MKQKDSSTKSKYVLINDFLFKYVGNPNYFGEIVEWAGYFIACQTIESSLFVFSTFNILTAFAIPRNSWNKKNIEGYPKSRKAIIPFLLWFVPMLIDQITMKIHNLIFIKFYHERIFSNRNPCIKLQCFKQGFIPSSSSPAKTSIHPRRECRRC